LVEQDLHEAAAPHGRPVTEQRAPDFGTPRNHRSPRRDLCARASFPIAVDIGHGYKRSPRIRSSGSGRHRQLAHRIAVASRTSPLCVKRALGLACSYAGILGRCSPVSRHPARARWCRLVRGSTWTPVALRRGARRSGAGRDASIRSSVTALGLVVAREWLVRRAGVLGCEPAGLDAVSFPDCPPRSLPVTRRTSLIMRW
jgi:hypothetical protein